VFFLIPIAEKGGSKTSWRKGFWGVGEERKNKAGKNTGREGVDARRKKLVSFEVHLLGSTKGVNKQGEGGKRRK